MATLQKGSQGTEFPTSFSPSSHPLASAVHHPNQIRSQRVREPFDKSIKISFLAHRAGWESIESDSRRGGGRKIFQHNFPYFFHRNQWQPNMRFLQIPTGLAILLLTSEFTGLLKFRVNVHFVLWTLFILFHVTSELGLGCFPLISTKQPLHESCVQSRFY